MISSSRGPSWTDTTPLPGGDLNRFVADPSAAYPFLPAALARRLARALTDILGRRSKLGLHAHPAPRRGWQR